MDMRVTYLCLGFLLVFKRQNMFEGEVNTRKKSSISFFLIECQLRQEAIEKVQLNQLRQN